MKQLKFKFVESEAIQSMIDLWSQRIIEGYWCGISKDRISELTKLPLYTIEKMIAEHIKRIK